VHVNQNDRKFTLLKRTDICNAAAATIVACIWNEGAYISL